VSAVAARMRPPGRRWPEYGLEALGLGTFMLVACALGALLESTGSPVRHLLPDPNLRRALMGVAMGATAVSLIYSPWGRRSGAHLNPATTLTFWRLGRVDGRDALPYALAQVAGGTLATLVAARLLGGALADPHVHFVVTRPGMLGAGVAFAAETVMTFVLMSVVLAMVGSPRWERYTGFAVGALVCAYIAFEAPLSGMSMNPARTLASAVAARDFTALWVYWLAPPLGMLLAAQLARGREARARARGAAPALRPSTACAKLRHDPALPCIFCGHDPSRELPSPLPH
jgi:aquaporin Z